MGTRRARVALAQVKSIAVEAVKHTRITDAG
jgi:hypothetical protein